MSITTLLRRSLVFLCIMTALTCAYTGALTLAGKALFPFQAEGSIITAKGKHYSTLLGQPFTADNHLWGRPVSADTATYTDNGKPLLYAGPSNKSPAAAEYAAVLQEREARIRLAHPEKSGQPIPVDLLTESGSGLDPHISPAAAEFQVERLARTTGFTAAEVRRTIALYTQGRTLGLLGEARVNVLEVNLALEGMLPNGRGVSGTSAAAPR
ncbi:MAG TPA: potassium-transporting ATPase subunit C [Desulfovibrio sp.]|uniref:potassium-transporting ATPase subunit C n=1 Tax=Desulfovibrio sp. TaxID=885 RepID=UPI002D24C487|nr:potassium-transporting ATPase subunit C [Desulfovibrio sp.]HZF61672.1 potassium-transporting ATPase subunit C [Desulfovibrio sp.]